MRILIFGAGGALADKLARVFLSEDIIALSHADCDITNDEAVRHAVEVNRPTHIINAAAYNNVDAAEENDTRARAVNTTAVGHLARAAAAHGAAFLHYSTDYVFDGVKQEGYREQDAPSPINRYGSSKLGGEQEIAHVAKERPSFLWYCVRTSRLFGPQGTAQGAKESFVDLMLQQGGGAQPLEVIDAEVSSPTYTIDLAAATLGLLTHNLPAGIYHLTNSGACTRYNCAKEIFRIWHELTGTIPPTLLPVLSFPNRKAARPAYSVLLSTKFPALRSWQEALRDYLSKKARI